MKPESIFSGRTASALAVIACTVTLLSWTHEPAPPADGSRYPTLTLGTLVPGFAGDFYEDTVPRERKVRDIDEAIDQLNEVDIDATIDQAMKGVKVAMENINAKDLQLQVKNALKQVDMEQIRKDVERSIAQIDWDQIKASVDAAQKIDWKKIQAEVQKAQREVELKGPELKVELEKARKEIEKAKVELKAYKQFLDGLEKDGLINKKDGYRLEYKNGELNINGKKASDETYKKYRSFLDEHKSFHIDTRDGEFRLNDGSGHNNDGDDNDSQTDIGVIS